MLGFLAAPALFGISLHSAFLNDVFCPLDNYVIRNESPSVNKHNTYDTTTKKYTWNSNCQVMFSLIHSECYVMGKLQRVFLTFRLKFKNDF